MIVLGLVLLILGLIFGVGILTTIGIILLVVGLILALFGMADRAIGPRRYYY
jgi:membrane protein implicated in regulation of membrane protease activity